MTVTIESATAVLAGGAGIVLLVLALGWIGMVIRFRAPVGSWRDQALTAKYVMRYDNALEWRGVARAERRSLTDELRRNIADAAATEGVSDSLERLGHPRDLANAVAARDRGPTWALGSFVALGVWFMLQMGLFFSADVLATGIEQLETSNADVSVTTPVFLGTTFEVTTDAAGDLNSLGVESSAIALLIPALAFVVFSTPWRLGTRKTARSAVEI